MKLTDKCKKAFEKWFNKNYVSEENQEFITIYPLLTEAMQFGVIQDFADSVGVSLEIEPIQDYNIKLFIVSGAPKSYKSRPEARQEAVKQFNKIYNETI